MTKTFHFYKKELNSNSYLHSVDYGNLNIFVGYLYILVNMT